MPDALIACHLMGDNRLWVAGGIGDQPVGLLTAANRAAYVEYLLKQEAKSSFKANETLTGQPMVDLMKLQELRKTLPVLE